MVSSYTIDLKILFKRFYCPICGEKLKVEMTSQRLMPEEENRYYKQFSAMESAMAKLQSQGNYLSGMMGS